MRDLLNWQKALTQGMSSRRKIISNILFYCGISTVFGKISSGGAETNPQPIDLSSNTDVFATDYEMHELNNNVYYTEKYLADHPYSLQKIQGYLDELKTRTNKPHTVLWVAFQNHRLDHVRWIVDSHDDGRKSGTTLKMRPYDIPWVVWCMGLMSDPGRWNEYMHRGPQDNDSTNGVDENVHKIVHSPGVKIEFTDKFSDFCLLCDKMFGDGCSFHPEFGGYGEVFPQPVQISQELLADCELALKVVGLKWTDVVSGEKLMKLCVDKAPDPAGFSEFPLEDQLWSDYRLGIKWWKINMM